MMSKGYRGIFRLSSSLEYACVLKLLAMVITLNPVHILKATALHFTCVNCMVCESYLNKAVKAVKVNRQEPPPGKGAWEGTRHLSNTSRLAATMQGVAQNKLWSQLATIWGHPYCCFSPHQPLWAKIVNERNPKIWSLTVPPQAGRRPVSHLQPVVAHNRICPVDRALAIHRRSRALKGTSTKLTLAGRFLALSGYMKWCVVRLPTSCSKPTVGA